MSALKRILSAALAAVLFGALVPIAAVLLEVAPAGLGWLLALVGAGVALGVVLGALFPKVFWFLGWVILDETD